MADAVVQLVRNFLCCLKDLGVLRGTAWADAKTVHKVLGALPPPMDETTPLELMICVTQFFACVSTTRSGIKIILNNLGKLKRVHRLVLIRQEQLAPKARNGNAKHNDNDNDAKILSPFPTHDRLINDSLFDEAQAAMRGIATGALVTPLGIAFFWLTANSLHITSTDWIGGLPALIHALEVMEICLFPLLYYMLTDGFSMLAQAKRLATQQDLITSGTPFVEDALTVQMFKTLVGSMNKDDGSQWEPYYASGVSFISDRNATKEEDEKQLQDEIDKVKSRLAELYPAEDKKKDDDATDTGPKTLASKHIGRFIKASTASRTKLKFEAYCQFVYFALNFIAFYGYLMGPLCYYYQDHDDENHELHHTKHPRLVQALRLWYRNVDADWHGNFAGDLMWTIEPIVILTSPMMLSYLVAQERRNSGVGQLKVKSE